MTENHVKYYIVPFVDRDAVTRTQAANLSIIVNAFTGRVEELCVFAEPVSYLTENEARRIAGLNLGLSQRETQTLQTELVYNPYGQYASCVFPTWRLTKEKTLLDISQDGVITKKRAQPHYFKGS